jgi:transposase
VNGDDNIIAAQRPEHPLGKCFASTALLANIMVSKYTDGLPLYRQESILKRYGHAVSWSNMAHWMRGASRY